MTQMSIQTIDDVEVVCYTLLATVVKAAASSAGQSSIPMQYPGHLEPKTEGIRGDVTFEVVTAASKIVGKVAGKGLFEEVAILTVRFFSPKGVPALYPPCKSIAEAVRNAFCNPLNNPIWYRDQKMTPAPGNVTENQFNVTVTCTYQILK